jgi:hypothetical protein
MEKIISNSLTNYLEYNNLIYRRCSGKRATGKSETVAVLSGRTFAGLLMVALLPIGIGKSATLFISIKKIMESVKESRKRILKILLFLYHNY